MALQPTAPINPKKPFWERALYIIGAIIALAFARNIIDAILKNNFKKEEPWSETYTNSVHKTLFDAYDNKLADSISKSSLADCVTGKFKLNYPNGINDVNPDTLKKYTRVYGYDCSKYLLLNYKPWPLSYDSALATQILKIDFVSKFKPKYKRPFCNCYIKTLETLYPGGVVDTVSMKQKDSITTACAKYVKYNIK